MKTMRASVLGLGLATSVVSAQVVDLGVDPSASSLTVQVTASISGLSLPASDSSPLTGLVSIELDDYATPTSIVLHGFDVQATEILILRFNAGFLGSATATLNNAGALYAGTSPTLPAPVEPGGSFVIANVPIELEGSGTTTGTGLFSDFGGTEFNLSDFGLIESQIAGTIAIVGEQIELNLSLQGSGSQVIEGVTFNGTATIELVASGDVPPPAVCLGDIADDFGFTVAEGGGPDGVVDFGDFVALLGLIGPCPGGTPGCLGDIADDFGFTVAEGGGPDGVVDFGDFVALLGLIGPCAG